MTGADGETLENGVWPFAVEQIHQRREGQRTVDQQDRSGMDGARCYNGAGGGPGNAAPGLASSR